MAAVPPNHFGGIVIYEDAADSSSSRAGSSQPQAGVHLGQKRPHMTDSRPLAPIVNGQLVALPQVPVLSAYGAGKENVLQKTLQQSQVGPATSQVTDFSQLVAQEGQHHDAGFAPSTVDQRDTRMLDESFDDGSGSGMQQMDQSSSDLAPTEQTDDDVAVSAACHPVVKVPAVPDAVSAHTDDSVATLPVCLVAAVPGALCPSLSSTSSVATLGGASSAFSSSSVAAAPLGVARRPLSELTRMQMIRELIPIDEIHQDLPENLGCYLPNIYANFRLSETRTRARHNYMDTQTDVTHSMRAILVDWLNEVAQEFNLTGETLFLSVNLIDRFLSHVPVLRNRLQLVGVTCMFIASKYQEILPPTVDDFVYITDNTYQREELLTMECQVLNTLAFGIVAATGLDFLNLFSKAARADPQVEALARFLLELTLQEYCMLFYPPSMVAVCCVTVALQTQGFAAWTPTLQYYSGYATHELRPCAEEVLRIFRHVRVNNLQAVREKFCGNQFYRVGELSAPDRLAAVFSTQ